MCDLLKKITFISTLFFLVLSSALAGDEVDEYDEANKSVNWVTVNKVVQTRFSRSRRDADRQRDCEKFAAQEHQKKGHEFFVFTYFKCERREVDLASIGFENMPEAQDILPYVSATTVEGIRNSLILHRKGEVFSVAEVLSEIRE